MYIHVHTRTCVLQNIKYIIQNLVSNRVSFRFTLWTLIWQFKANHWCGITATKSIFWYNGISCIDNSCKWLLGTYYTRQLTSINIFVTVSDRSSAGTIYIHKPEPSAHIRWREGGIFRSGVYTLVRRRVRLIMLTCHHKSIILSCPARWAGLLCRNSKYSGASLCITSGAYDMFVVDVIGEDAVVLWFILYWRYVWHRNSIGRSRIQLWIWWQTLKIDSSSWYIKSSSCSNACDQRKIQLSSGGHCGQQCRRV